MLWTLVMAGGWGTRLWPLSTRKIPKPFLKILPGEKSLFEECVRRVRAIVPAGRILIIGNENHLGLMRAQAKGIPARQIIGEPESKNTAATVALAASLIAEKDPFASLLVLPADHLIRQEKKFRAAVEKARSAALRNQSFCVFGVRPGFPSDSYGYLERGAKLSDGIFELKRFVEKPSGKKAQEFIKTGRFDWHAGIFVAPASVILDAVGKSAPKILKLIKRLKIKNGKIVSRGIFARLPNISIDYAVLERLKRACMVAGTFDWCDVGSWKVFDGLWPKDKDQNVYFGTLNSVDGRSNIVYSPNQNVVIFGLNDLVVINTPKALLITNKNASESMRKLAHLH